MSKIFKLHLESHHYETVVPETGDKTQYAQHTSWVMPLFRGVSSDRVARSEIVQILGYWERVLDGWPEKGFNSEKKEGL